MTSISRSNVQDLTSWLKKQREVDRRPLSQLLGEHQLPVEDMLELAVVDLIESWRVGAPLAVETYLTDFPELAERSECVLDLIDAEICVRRERKERVTHEELSVRFPALSDRLARMLDIEAVELNLVNLGQRSSVITSAGLSYDLSSEMQQGRGSVGDRQIQLDGQTIDAPEGIRLVGLVSSRPGVQLYRAMSKDDRRPLALKVIRQSSADQRSPEQWMNHLELANKLRNPRFVGAEIAIANFHHFIVVRSWIEGLNWSEWASRNAPAEQLLRPLVTIADALQTAHTAGIPHGHLHPGNILINHDSQARVTDLGCSAISSHAHDWRPVDDDPRSSDPNQLRLRDLYAIAALTISILDRQGASAAPRWRPLHAIMQQARAKPGTATPDLLAEAMRRSIDGREPSLGNPSWIRRWWNSQIRTGESP